jgi:hypothetical protein
MSSQPIGVLCQRSLQAAAGGGDQGLGMGALFIAARRRPAADR